ncbi:MAG TPA: hypothetical protein VFI13_09260, partial [Gemmatimonadales bacterium]|nr:hypothetical protein [Gemmatimonadales bacterium]
IADDPRFKQALRTHSPLAIKAAKSLYLTACFRDLPEASRLHPGMQRRMFDAGPMMTEAVLGMREHLANLTDGQKKELQAKLRAEPALGEALCRTLDDQVGMARLQPERRVRQRMVMASYAWRMQHQSVAAVIDPQLDKANRFLERTGDDEVLFGGPEPETWTGQDIGLRMMGIGAVTFGVSLILLLVGSLSGPLGSVGAIGTTVGGALLVIGLLVVIFSALAEAADDAEGKHRRAPSEKAPSPAPAPEPGPSALPPI